MNHKSARRKKSLKVDIIEGEFRIPKHSGTGGFNFQSLHMDQLFDEVGESSREVPLRSFEIKIENEI